MEIAATPVAALAFPEGRSLAPLNDAVNVCAWVATARIDAAMSRTVFISEFGVQNPSSFKDNTLKESRAF